MEDQVTIKDIFNQSQTGLQGHGKLIKSLTNIYKKTDLTSFTSDFFHCMKYPMVVFRREPAVERVIDFIAKFLPSLVKKEPNKDKDKKLEGEEGAEEEEDEVDILADNKLLQETFDFLLQHHSARDRAVRFRCCQLINKLLANLGDEAQIDDELYDRLYECMLDRLKDKCPVVRYHAVLAMARLQDPSDDNCPVIKAYLFLLNCDPNADVRRSVLTSIAPSTKTLASIVGRTRDVKDTVRKAAYLVLSEKIHVKALSIAVRLQLLNEGLNDRSDMVKQACSGKLLQVWMRIFGGSILNLLKSLDVEDSTETCCIVVETLFKGSTMPEIVQDFNLLGEKLLIPEDMLTSESVFYWQMICKYIHKMGTDGDEYLDKVLPNCVDFCGYVKQYIDGLKAVEDPEVQLGREFIIEQLLLIASYMDTADTASRKALDNLLHNMVIADHVSHRLVSPFVLRICQLRGDNESLVQYFAELVSEIREPITLVEKDIADEQKRQLNLKIASIRVKLNQSREELDEAVRSQDFTKAAELKEVIAELDEEKIKLLEASEPAREEIRSERNDPLTIQKCQTIISEMLKNLNLNAVSPTMQMMIESQILPGIQNEDADVRNMAMQALGLCCFMSKDLLVTYLPLFMQASQIDVELVRNTALQVLFDLLLIYGLDVIDATESGESSSSGEDNPDAVPTDEEKGQSEVSAGTASKLVAIICSFLDGESSDLRTTAAEGLAKLLLSGRVVSSKILSHLILLWYNPMSEDETHLRDCLGTFFPLFALGCRSNQELVEEAFLPTLKTLLNAPTTSPLAEVDVNNVAELLVPLTNSTLLTKNQNASETSRDNPGHDNLSEKVCNEILSDPTSPNVKLWIRILNQMEVSPDNEMVLKDLRILCFKMMKTVTDKLCLKNLSKFRGNISELASKYVTNDDDLENIEIEPPAELQEVEGEEAIQTPKRKKRGLYSQNITLESDVLDMDISQDATSDIDASCLMSRSSTTSDTPSKRSRKNTATTEIALDDDNIFLKPDAPAQKVLEATADKEEEGNAETAEESENDEGEKNNKAPEKRKSELQKTTPEKRPRIVEEKSPETRRSRSKGRKQKSPKSPRKETRSSSKSPQKETTKSSSKSPQKETTKSSSKSPQKETTKGSSKSPRKETTKSSSKSPSKASDKTSRKDSSRTRARKASKSPVKNSADKAESATKSPDNRSSSKRKASTSPSRRESESPGKRQRSTDVPSNPHLKRKASPGRRDSKSPEMKRRSQSQDKLQNKKTDTSQNKTSVSKSTSKSVQQKDANNKQANRNVRQMPSRNTKPSTPPKQKVLSKEGLSNSTQKEVNKNDIASDKSSPRKTRGALASVVADTPEAQSKSLTSKRPGMSIAETPEMDSTPGSRRSARANGTPQSLDTPILSSRSTRSVRGTPSTESDHTPRQGTKTTKNMSETPDTSTQRASVRGKGTPQSVVTPILSTRSARSVRGTPSTESDHTPRQGTKTTKNTSETPDTSTQRASVRGKGTTQSVVTPILSTRSARSVRKTPSTESEHTPRQGTKTTSETPDTSTQRASVRGKGSTQSVVTPTLATRSARSVRKTPSTESEHTPRQGTKTTKSVLQTQEVTSPKDGKQVKKAVKTVVEKKKTVPSKSTDESLSSSGSSPESQSKSKTSSRSSGRETQSQSDSNSSSSSKFVRAATGRFKRPVPTKRTDESVATTTTDDDDEEDQIRRRVRPSRKSAGSKSSEVKQPNTEKTTNIPVSLTRSSVRDASKSKDRNTTEKGSPVASTAASNKPATPRSQKSDSDEGGVFSSPGSATRSTRTTRMTGVSQTTNAKPVNKRTTTGRNTTVPVKANKSTKQQQPRWK